MADYTVAGELSDDLAFSIDQLCTLVEEIKDGFQSTLLQLSKVEEDDLALRSKLDHSVSETSEKFDGIHSAINHLKEQFTDVNSKVHSLEENQRSLQLQLHSLTRSQSCYTTDSNHQRHVKSVSSAYGSRSACTTPMSTFCPPMSPDSGLQGPSPDLHCFLTNQRPVSHMSMATTTTDDRNPITNANGLVQAHLVTVVDNDKLQSSSRSPPDSVKSAESMTAEANKSLDLSKALAERFLHDADSSDEDCDLDKDNEESMSSSASDTNCEDNRDHRRSRIDEYDNNQLNCMTSSHHSNNHTSLQLTRRPAPHEKLHRENQRNRVCEEFVETERKYCSCLWTIIDLIAETLKSAAIVSMKDLCLIFPRCLPRLYEIHSVFLCMLEEKINDSNETVGVTAPKSISFCNTFLDLLQSNDNEFIEIYRSYVNDFTTAVETIHKYTHHSGKFRKLVHTLQHHPNCEGLDLTAFLLTPVQRVPRYLLLMKQLSLFTDDDHPEYTSLSDVLTQLHALLEELNYSIQTALHKASQSGRRKKPSLPRRLKLSSTNHIQSSSCESLARPPVQQSSDLIIFDNSNESAVLSGSSRSMNLFNRIMRKQVSETQDDDSLHFLAVHRQQQQVFGWQRRGTMPDLMPVQQTTSTPKQLKRWNHNRSPAYQRCRSVPPVKPEDQQVLIMEATKQVFQAPSPSIRSRAQTRRLRHADRSLSAGDILKLHRHSPDVLLDTIPVRECHDPALLMTSNHWTGQKSRRRKTSPRPSLKESFRKMFMPRKKSVPCVGSEPITFQDENGDPCTNV